MGPASQASLLFISLSQANAHPQAAERKDSRVYTVSDITMSKLGRWEIITGNPSFFGMAPGI
jgi:hypothetical protein